MKQKFTATMMVPKYVTQFQCIGENCPDSCCAGWKVTIDKDSFREYRRVIHPLLKPLLRTHLVQNNKNSDSAHGTLNLRTSDQDCGLHSPEGLCSIQQHLGEDALSDTCFIYPRTVIQVGDRLEQSLTLSCPEAARLALTQDDAFEFVSADFTTRQSTTTIHTMTHGFDLFVMDEVRALSIQLFQTDGLSNIERLAVLGWLCKQLDELAASNEQAHVHEVLKELVDLVETGAVKQVVSQLAHQSVISANVFSILFGTTRNKGSTPYQQTVMTWAAQGLGLDQEAGIDPATLEANYLRGLDLLNSGGNLFEKMLARHLLNDILREVFPWKRASAMLHYRRLLSRFGILRLMLAGIAAARGTPLDEKLITQVIQVFCRLYQHNDHFAARAEQILTGSEWDKLDRLYTLLQ